MKSFDPKSLPPLPGVYLFKDAENNVIYIGKARSLRDRVSTYFQEKHPDWKVVSLLNEYASLETIVTHTEHDALLLEVQLVQKYQPKYNVLLKSGQPYVYIHVTKSALPKLEIVRNKKKAGTYVGPFLHKQVTRHALNYLMNTFKLYLCNKNMPNGCLDYHLGRCAGTCLPNFDAEGYKMRVQLALDALHGDRTAFLKRIDEEIKKYNAQHVFETSRYLHSIRENFEDIFATLAAKFTESKYFQEVVRATAPFKKLPVDTEEVGKIIAHNLGLSQPVRTIDCFDISHFQSHEMVGSCVRFTDGKPDKQFFRKFNIKSLHDQNDYAALQEIVQRRYGTHPEELPDVVLIDGGKGQLNAVREVLPNATIVSLAKREERLYSSAHPEGRVLDVSKPEDALFIALRDYAHHFAISHHRYRLRKQLSYQ